jgi:aminoglycoside phosphotransferase (APT) family kinase protein
MVKDIISRHEGSVIIETMMGGAPQQARSLREEPRRTLPLSLLERVVQTAFLHGHVIGAHPLAEGLRNANFKLELDCTPDVVVLRIYEHDASLCEKELDLMRLIGGSVPVPEVIYAEPRGWEDLPPFTLMRHIEGISFHELHRRGDTRAISEAAHSVGETLAAIGRTTFAKSGWLAPGPTVTDPPLEGADPVPRFVDKCLESPNLQQRVPSNLRGRTHAFVWSMAPQLTNLDPQAQLVHGDFGKRNLLVRSMAGQWRVAAVLDWEFAMSGTPLTDLGHFLRYEQESGPVAEPHFSDGYLQAGGKLSQNWRQLARLIDLTALSESLTHDHLPDTVVTELVELIHATVENREPEIS